MPPTDNKRPRKRVKRKAAPPRDAIYQRPKPKVRKPVVRSEVAAAGGVATKRADKFKKTKVFKRAVTDAKKAAAAQRYDKRLGKATGGRELHHPLSDYERRIRVSAVAGPSVTSSRAVAYPVKVKKSHLFGVDALPTTNSNRNAFDLVRGGKKVATGVYTKQSPFRRQSGFDKASKSVVEPVVRDYRDLTIGLVPATYHLAETAVHDPGAAGKMLVQPYKDLFNDPVKSFKEHPLGTPLLIAGPIRGGSRAAGAGARRGVFGPKGRRAGSTAREPAKVPNTNIEHPRSYDKGLLEKGVQVANEKRQVRKVRKLQTKATKLEQQGKKAEARAVRHEAALKSPTRATPEHAKRRVHEIEAEVQETRAQHATQADVEVHMALRQPTPTGRKVRRTKQQLPRKSTPAVGLAAQNITRATPDDFKAYRAELAHQHEHGDLNPSQRALNEQLRGQITEALDSGADMGHVRAGAAAYEKAVSSRTKKLVKYGALEPATVAKRIELPYAVRSMNATRGRPKPTAERVQASKDLAAAQRARAKAERAHARTREQYGVAKGRGEILSRNVGGRASEVKSRREVLRRERADLKRKLEADPEILKLEKQLVETPPHDPRRLDLAGQLAASKAELAGIREASGRKVGPRLTEDELALGDVHQKYVDTLSRLEGLRKRESSSEGAHLQGELLRERMQHLEEQAKTLRAHRDQLAKFIEHSGGVRMAGGGHGVNQAYAKLRASEIDVRTARQAAKAAEERVRVVRKQRVPKQFVTPEGEALPTEAVRATRQGEGLPTPAYVSHAPNLTRPGSFYRHAAKPITTENRAFTGESVTKGTHDVSEEALHANVRKLQTIIDVRDGHKRFVEQTGLRLPNGELARGRTHADVQAHIDALTKDRNGHKLPGAEEFSIVNLEALRANKAQLQRLVEEVNQLDEIGVKGGENPLVQSLQSALEGKGTEGPFAAIPKVVLDEQQAFLRTLGGSDAAAWNVALSVWRKTKLAFSPLWATANVTEATFRSLLEGATPVDWMRARKTFAAMDPDEAARALAQLGHGGHAGFVQRSQRHSSAEEFMSEKYGRGIRQIAKLSGAAARTPVVNWVPKFYSAWTTHVFEGMAAVERQFRVALAGRHIRSWLTERNINEFGRISEEAVQQAAKGFSGTREQVELARFVRRAYGQYEAWSPRQRRWISQYTPFLAWTRNAVMFLVDVLPRDHPVFTGLMADISMSQDEWLAKEGLLPGRGNSLPNYLLGGQKTSSGGMRRLAKYTPLGIMADPVESIAGVLMPMTREVQFAAFGLDAFGNKLKVSKGQAILEAGFGMFLPPIAATAFKESSTPFLERVKRQTNPLYVTPAEKVRLAQVSEELNRIDTAQQTLFRELKSKAPQSPEFKRLDLRERALKAERSGLFVKTGVDTEPTAKVDAEIARLEVQADRIPPNERVDQYGFATKEYQALRDRINALRKQRNQALGKKPARRVKRRPLTPREQILKETRDLREGSSPEAIRKELRDEMNRLREQAKVNRGG